MRHRRFLLILVFLGGGYTQAISQKIAVSATVDEQKILIGEQLHLTLQATAPAPQNINWFQIDTLPHFEVLSRSKIDTQTNAGTKTLVQTLTLTSWDSGRWQLPSFFLQRSNRTKPIPVEVVFSPFDPAQNYHDVKDILEVSKPDRISWYWYAVGVVLLAVLFFLLFPGRKKKKEERLQEGAYKNALARLDALKKKGITEGEAKQFYTELIFIFREYLQHRKNIQSFSRTTDDLAVQILQLSLPVNQYHQLVDVLQLGDFVKFAKFRPPSSDNQNSFETIKKSIVAIENQKEVEVRE